MTTNRKPANCTDCGRKLSSANRSTTNDDMCNACDDYAAWENTHEDEGHDYLGEGSVDNDLRSHCPVCQGDKPVAPAAKAGHTNTAPKTHTSHKGHDHPATPKARAACRKARDAKA